MPNQKPIVCNGFPIYNQSHLSVICFYCNDGLSGM